MKNSLSNNIRLGLFITVGTIALVAGLYLIGSNRSIFSKSIKIHSHFYGVDGLKAGNNVRYAGIDIGTVDKVVLENDSSVSVYMIIEEKHSKYIRKNCMAMVGTDGLMGNKIVNINPGIGEAPAIEDGDEISSVKPIENAEMVRTLSTTNDNLAAITADLKKFTSNLSRNKGILKLLEDSVSAINFKEALGSIRHAADNANRLTIQLNQMADGINSGRGVAGVLLRDTAKATELRHTLSNLKKISDSLNLVVSGLHEFAESVNNPDGTLYAVMNDTALAENVKAGIGNLEQSTLLLNENLKAMRRSFLFRRYFREQEKQAK
jgi:phospholipid/cholesterol/gamma-HCH transport system substrate-binding protein